MYMYFLMPYSVWYNVCSAVYVHCSLCGLRLFVQFMCTPITCAVYVYCDHGCSLCVLGIMVQFMCTVSSCAVYGYCRIFIQFMATVYVIQLMSTAYLIQFVGSHDFR